MIQKQQLQFRNDPLVVKMVNLLMKNGKKSKAEKILDRVFGLLDEAYPGQAINIFYSAVSNVQTLVGVREKPKGKRSRRSLTTKETFVPYFMTDSKSQAMAIRLIFLSVKSSKTTLPLWERLGQELLEVSLKRSDLTSMRSQLRETCDLNRRFYRFCWRRKFPVDPDSLSGDHYKEITRWRQISSGG